MTALSGWENFYVIVGSSAGALIGLQFVVITLIADLPISDSGAQAGNAFATPTVVHFGAALLVSAIMCAPWGGVGGAALAWGILGLCGLGYELIVARRMRMQHAYRPVPEDWLFYVVLPLAAYALLAVSACAVRAHVRNDLFVVAAAALLLLFTGIHNAWDAVIYHVFVQRRRSS